MASTDKKAGEIVQLYFESHSPTTVIRIMLKRYPSDARLSKQQIHRLVKKFQQTGSVQDKRHKNQGCPRTSRSDENITVVGQIIQETPEKSVRKVLGNMENERNASSSLS